MKHLAAASLSVCVTLAAASSFADGVTVRRGQFTDRVERGAPVAPPAELPRGGRVLYWVEASNPGAPAQITLVWRVGGREVTRQELEVGHAPRWRTWGALPRRGSGTVEVRVLDASGAEIHRDRLGGS